MKRFFALAVTGIALAMAGAFAQAPAPQLNFGEATPVIDLSDKIVPYQAEEENADENSSWYMVNVINDNARAVSRVLQVSELPHSGLEILPRSTRPAIVQVASSDSSATVDQASAYGRRAFRAVIPPSSSVSLAIRVANADAPPLLLAWTEPALASFNRQMAIFIAAVAGLIGAAALIVAGIAVMTGHSAPRWAALTLALILLSRLAAAGMFDASLATDVGGPYGLMALFAGLALASGTCLVDKIVPLRFAFPRYAPWLRYGLLVLCALAIAAYLGLPGASLLVDACVVLGTALISVYLVHQGRIGVQAARVSAPSALVFALVSFAATIIVVVGANNALTSSAVIGGFLAAGTVLMALAVAAGEGVTLLPLPHIAQALYMRSGGSSKSQDSAAAAIKASLQGVFDLDFSREQLTLSPDIAQLVGLPGGTTISFADWLDRIHPGDRGVYEEALQDYRAQPGAAFRIEFRAGPEGGPLAWLELRASMIGNHWPATHCLGLIADISGRKQAEASASGRPTLDSVTGLGNRAALMAELDNLGIRFRTTVIAILDIDRFKSIHASLGDTGGDELLSKIAERLSSRLRGVANLYRVGGDSFAVVFEKMRGTPEAMGANLVEIGKAAYDQGGRNVFAPASVGIALARDAQDPAELLKNAELALYQAKRQGGACARLFTLEMKSQAPGDAVALEADLRRALEKDELDLFYQPIVALDGGTVVGFEALLRWHHPTKGLVTPGEFIAHSEETGLIVALGYFALERAIRDMEQWQRYFPLTHPLFVSVNLSRRQLQDRDFEKNLTALIRKGVIAAGSLKLEVTESIIASDSSIRARLGRIRELGAGLSIDDFGTGASSLSQLKDIPFDTVKFDRSFLARDETSKSKSPTSVVLSNIIAMARELGRTVVVEGIESENDVQWLRNMGCGYGQGYYFSPALSAKEALQFIARHYDAGDAANSGAPGFTGQA